MRDVSNAPSLYHVTSATSILTRPLPFTPPFMSAGELDVSLARRPRTPVAAGQSLNRPTFPGMGVVPRPNAKLERKVSLNLTPSKVVEATTSGGGSGAGRSPGTGSAQENSPISAVGVAWEAFKAHGGGASLPSTVKAAVTATSIAVEHVRMRTRERLLLEKGTSAGKRLSGPVQITLQDLQVRRARQLACVRKYVRTWEERYVFVTIGMCFVVPVAFVPLMCVSFTALGD